MFLEAFVDAVGLLLDWRVLLALGLGTIGGLIGGALPGTGLAGLFVLIGFAYTLDPVIAIPLAIGFIVPVATTDSIPAILLGVPGSASTQAIIMDGYPLARQGKAEWALACTYWSSIFGSLVGVVVLLVSIPFARAIIGVMGSPEFLMVGLLGIGIVGLVSTGDHLRGLVTAVFGMIIATVGTDPIIGEIRMSLDTIYLIGGIGIIPFTLGLFAIPELAALIGRGRAIADNAGGAAPQQPDEHHVRSALKTVAENRRLVVQGSAVGSVIGAMPGVGLSVVDWLTYGLAKSTVKDGAKTFGKGDIRGLIAPSSADNATLAAALIPTLALAIPGGLTMAIFLGFMIIVGVQPGPTMLTDNLDLIYLIILCVALSNVLAGGTALSLSRHIGKLTRIRGDVLFAPIIAVLALAALQTNFEFIDLWVFLGFGLLGSLMVYSGWPRVPMIIGYVLSPILERYYWLTVQNYGWSFLRRPAVWVILGVGIVTAVVMIRITLSTKAQALDAEDVDADEEVEG